MTSDIRVGRGVQDIPQNRTLYSRKRKVARSKMAKKRGTSLMDVPKLCILIFEIVTLVSLPGH